MDILYSSKYDKEKREKELTKWGLDRNQVIFLKLAKNLLICCQIFQGNVRERDRTRGRENYGFFKKGKQCLFIIIIDFLMN